ncbi:MAG: STAS domain-containing protein [Victivallales bacterium]
MDIQSKIGNGFTSLTIKGRLDAVTATAAEAAINRTIESGASNLILDLAGLDYVSSAGLRVLLVTAKRLSRQNGKIVLCGLQDAVREVFTISGFMSIFPVAANEAEASKSFQTT